MRISRRDFASYLAATAFGGLATSPFAEAESLSIATGTSCCALRSGGIDVPIRLIAHELSERLHQQFFIENVAGGGTSIGTTQVARAIADGYTVLFSIPAQLKLLKEYAAAQGFAVVQEYVDVETAKQTGRTAFGEMVAYLKAHPSIRVMLVREDPGSTATSRTG